MRKKKVGVIAIKSLAIKSFALLVVFGTAYLGMGNQAMAQDATTPYPNIVPTKMAPIDQYLMTDRGGGNRAGAKCSAGVHFTRCRGSGSWTSWFRNGGQRQKRFRVYRGTFVDFRTRC